MTKILFVCHGRICRSPMAEYFMKDLVRREGREEQFEIASAATSRSEIGNDVYPSARKTLFGHGVSCPRRAARQLTRKDFDEYDLVIGMDSENLAGMRHICGDGDARKIHLLMDFTDHPGDVADPWYTRDFEATWRDVSCGCRCLLKQISDGMLP